MADGDGAGEIDEDGGFLIERGHEEEVVVWVELCDVDRRSESDVV